MKRISFVIVILSFWMKTGTAQSLSTELGYLEIVNKQEPALIKDNLRNAEMMADTLFFHPLTIADSISVKKQAVHDSLAAFFFKELAMSYFKTENYPMALFTFLRQRYFYPNRWTEKFVSDYFVRAAAFANLKKDYAEFLLENSTCEKLKTLSFNERKVEFLDKAVRLNIPDLNPVILHYVDITRESDLKIPEFVNRWSFLVTIGMRQNLMEGFLNYYEGNLDSLSFKQQKIFNRKAARYYLKNNAWLESEKYLEAYSELPLKFNNRLTYGWFRFRQRLRF